jgi:hypothetical protein
LRPFHACGASDGWAGQERFDSIFNTVAIASRTRFCFRATCTNGTS